MELKLICGDCLPATMWGFNRTFMELKQLEQEREELDKLVLIGPS